MSAMHPIFEDSGFQRRRRIGAGSWSRTRRTRSGRPGRLAAVWTVSAILGFTVLAAIAPRAAAQEYATPAPVFSSIDERGVDLVTGALTPPGVSVGIGDAASGGLQYTQMFQGSVWRGGLMSGVIVTPTTLTVSIGQLTELFTDNGTGIYAPARPAGNTLAFIPGALIYTTTDGTIYEFQLPIIGEMTILGGSLPYVQNGPRVAKLKTVTRPDGEVVTYHYNTVEACIPEPLYPPPLGPECVYQVSSAWLQSITNNYGYQLHLEYDGNYYWPKKVTAINNAVEYCAPTAATCAGLTQTWPSLTYNAGAPRYASVTDQAGRTTSYTYDIGGRIAGIKYPGSATDDISITYYTSGANSGRVNTVTAAGVTWTYAYADASGNRTTTVTSPAGSRTAVSSLSTGRVTSVTDELGRTTSYLYDSSSRITRITQPEGNYTQYTYDARGNVTQAARVAKSGSGLANITVSAAYPASCGNPVTCNKPESVTDARGFRTDFTYDSTHGGVLTVTSPAPSGSAPIGSGARPQTRYTYAQKTARYKTSASGFANGSAIYVLTGTSSCATGSSCNATANETVAAIAYPSAGVANNLLPVSVTSAAGNGVVSTTTAFTYDDLGNVLTVDGPLAGAADTTAFKYDAAGRVLGSIGPDPDGAGALLRRASRLTYDSRGQVTFAEQGTTTAQTDAAFAAFSRLARTGAVYDSAGRTVQSRLYSGASSTVLALAQQTYDSSGRPECTAVRMNPAVYASVAPSCAPGTAGAYGEDRVSRTYYDAAGQVTTARSAAGAALQQNTVTTTYSANGLPLTVADARGYRTTYEYDGHDRLVKIRYPHPSSTGTSSTTDYEQFTYDAAGNVLTARTRAGQTFTYAYDNLNRVTAETPPSPDPATTTAYDLMGRVTSVTRNGQTLTYAYDALSRMLSETGPLGAVSYQYDATGAMTRITWPDNFYVAYEYDATGAVTAVREYGSTLLASYAYDNLGRRTGVTRGNSTSTAYAYDGLSRLSGLTQNPASTPNDQTFAYAYNPASQITSRTRTNAAYDWITMASGTASYSHNGLNQTISFTSASPAPSYDANGNMTWDGTAAYAYDRSNRMTTAGATALSYDPGGRLYQAGTTRFLYAGSAVIAELDGSGNVLRRYVPGPGVDEPVVWYEGSGASDRRWLLSDERGSVIAVTNGAGAALAINKYDEYGAPAAANIGRFQYTGQMWLAEAGLYHYKARAYNPRIGRFMQTDPIGYGDGMNLYAYVGNDPINRVDPTGLCSDNTIDEISQARVVMCGGQPAAMPWAFQAIWEAHLRAQSIEWGQALAVGLGSAIGNSISPGVGGAIGGAVMSCENPIGVEVRTQAVVAASRVAPLVTYDSANEVSALRQYFSGDSTPIRLSAAEMSEARSYVTAARIFSPVVLSPGVVQGHVNFTNPNRTPNLDGLLGQATVVTVGGQVSALSDTFNFDFKDRGSNYGGSAATLGVLGVRMLAATCGVGDTKIPVVGQ